MTGDGEWPGARRLLVVEHGRHAPAGLLAGWAASRSLHIETVALHAGQPLPTAPGFDAVAVLGSELTAYDDSLPWLAAELAFIERMLAASVPVLGICFGGQALARVLGARLYRLPVPEIGWAHVTSGHPALAEGPWLSWHRDAFDLPAGAVQLAANAVCVQGFSYGQHAGLQFHPEATQPIAASWLRFATPPPGEEITRALFRDSGDAWDRAAAHAGALFSAWLDGTLAGPVSLRKRVAAGRRLGSMDDTEALLAAFDEQARAEPPVPPAGVWHEPDGPVLRVVGQERGFIAAPRDTGARGADLDRLIARQRDYFAARGEAVEWKTYGYDEPPDLPGRLRAAGFAAEDTQTVVVALASAIAAEPVLPAGVALRQVTADADMRRIAAMESQVWGTDRDWSGDHLIREAAAAPDDFIVLAAEATGQVVAAGWIAFRPGTEFAGLWGGATLREWRGKGIYRALVARRAQLAADRGVRYLQVDASSDSAPILRRLGFVALTTTTPYVWTPPS